MKRRTNLDEEINSYVVMGLVEGHPCEPTWIQTNNINSDLLFRYIKDKTTYKGKYENLVGLFLFNYNYTSYTKLLQFIKKYDAFFNKIDNYNTIIENLIKLSSIEELIYNNYVSTYQHLPIIYSSEIYENIILATDPDQEKNLEIYNNYYSKALENVIDSNSNKNLDSLNDEFIQKLAEYQFENQISEIIENNDFLLINYLNDVLTNIYMSTIYFMYNNNLDIYQLIDNVLQQIEYN